jgi:aryl-alcohol dehydrogenase-like predicted oxidoreductase
LQLPFIGENGMQTRQFGRTGWQVGEIGFGSWAIGSAWGPVAEPDAIAALAESLDNGVNFIDTADVYGDHVSERLIARVLAERARAGKQRPIVATKIGRRLPAQQAALYTYDALAPFVDGCLESLQMEALDLVQLHCPPTDVYYRPDVFDAMDRLQRAGKIRNYGVSVERVEEGIKALGYPGVASVQIIFNIFRQRPAELFFELARRRQVAVIVRVPLASGLLTGKFTAQTTFDTTDHRQFNRHGEAFDVGETFAGIPYELGLSAVEDVRPLVPAGATMAQFALRWILMHEAVSIVIPGAKNGMQARMNAAAADLPPVSADAMAQIRTIYDTKARAAVHHRW